MYMYIQANYQLWAIWILAKNEELRIIERKEASDSSESHCVAAKCNWCQMGKSDGNVDD